MRNPNIWYPPTQYGGYSELPPQQSKHSHPYSPSGSVFEGGIFLGVASLVCGIVSIFLLVVPPIFLPAVLAFFSIPISLVCMVLSIVFAVVDRKKRGEFHGVTLAGFITGLIVAGFWFFVGCLFCFTILLASTGGGGSPWI